METCKSRCCRCWPGSLADRRAYLRNVLPLTHDRGQFLIYVHEWPYRWYDRLIRALFRISPMQPCEIEADFGPHFHVEKIMERYHGQGYLAGEAVYLMRRR